MNKKTEKTDKVNTVKKTKPSPTKKEVHVNHEGEIKIETKPEFPLRKEIDKLEIAYKEAIGGKIKFKKVRTLFEEIHKEIKSSVKKSKE